MAIYIVARPYDDIQVNTSKCTGREEPIVYPDCYSNLSINSI